MNQKQVKNLFKDSEKKNILRKPPLEKYIGESLTLFVVKLEKKN